MDNKKNKTIFAITVFAAGFLLIPVISYLRAVAGDFNYPPMTRFVRFPALAIFTFLFYGYWRYLKVQELSGPAKIKPAAAVGMLFLGAFLLSVYPIFSIDLYEYIIRGRILALYHANPYLHPPEDFQNDMYYHIVYWKTQTMIYGPVWAYLVSSVVWIAKSSIFLTQFFVKSWIFLFHLGISFFVYKIAKERGLKRPDVACAAYLLNPFILIMALMEGHMDTVMIFFLAGSVYALYKKKPYMAFFLLALSALTKYLTLIFVPFYLVYMYLDADKKSRFVKEALVSLAVMAVTAAAVYGPLWAGLSTFSAFSVVGLRFDTNTFPYIYYQGMRFIVHDLSRDIFRYGSYAMFALSCAVIFGFFVKAKNKERALIASILSVLTAYILFASFQLGAWYLLWIIPFILLSEIPEKYLLSTLISFASLISFWKRVSFLNIAALSIYAIILFVRRKNVHAPGQE